MGVVARHLTIAIGALALVACSGSDGAADIDGAAESSELTAGATTGATVEDEPTSSALGDVGADSDSGTTTPGQVGEAEIEVAPEGFTTATVQITKADGATCEVCMWLADQPEERGQGLMGVTSLGSATGMVFVFDEPRDGSFFMFQTVTPLSIAFFADDGAFISSTDMEPCPSLDSSTCERFFADGPHQLAIEVFQGDLDALGIGEGSRATVVSGTEAAACPLQS